jgi:CHAD domain-containing protein
MKVFPIAKFAVDETRGYLKQFKKNLRNTAKHPEDPEAIHDLRVSIRRLTQCFRTFRGLLEPRRVKKLQRRLRKVMDYCGAVRNCDVALDLLRQSGIAHGASVSKLKNARADAGKELRRYLKKERRNQHTAPGLAPGASDGIWKLGDSPQDNLRRILPGLAKEFFEAGALAAVTGASLPTLHQFRLSSKRFRYTLEIFERFYGTEMSCAAKAMKGVQDRLGAINDCAVTLGLLAGDRRAAAAVRKRLEPSIVEFREYWETQFSPAKLAWWKRMLSRPAVLARRFNGRQAPRVTASTVEGSAAQMVS